MVNSSHYDRWLLFFTAVLVIFGTIMIYSSTSVVTPLLAKKNVTPFFFFKRHMLTVVISILFMFLAFRTSPETLNKVAIWLLVLSLVLLVLVFVPKLGVTAGGARRWLRLWPSTFQPSELVKLSMVIFLARYMSSPSYRGDSFRCFIIPVALMGLFQLIFLKQPDFGAAMSLCILTIAMLVLSGTRLRHIMLLGIILVPVSVKLLMEPYRLKRILAFLDPWKDSQGAGFQLVQSFIALGSGGLTGIGLGESKQKLSFLPESHTDFIFSLVGEELGFIGVFSLVGLFLVLFLRGISIANRTKDLFGYYLASGLSMMIALQALINFSVTAGLVPTKGLPLPFVSYGGSSLLINMMAVGILLRLSRGEDTRRVVDKTETLIKRKKAFMSVYGRTPATGRYWSVDGRERS
ncbi:MAG TPA: putative lipid II flippase FtsW [Thermodesulfovibrionales bacterium]|nr:putative lipid II flippase FtsW [Thermodesulfovibrionales bacterium]